jgi:hypothetical protein
MLKRFLQRLLPVYGAVFCKLFISYGLGACESERGVVSIDLNGAELEVPIFFLQM